MVNSKRLLRVHHKKVALEPEYQTHRSPLLRSNRPHSSRPPLLYLRRPRNCSKRHIYSKAVEKKFLKIIELFAFNEIKCNPRNPLQAYTLTNDKGYKSYWANKIIIKLVIVSFWLPSLCLHLNINNIYIFLHYNHINMLRVFRQLYSTTSSPTDSLPFPSTSFNF